MLTIRDDDLGEALRGACAEATRGDSPSIVSVSAALRKQVDRPDDALAAVVSALDYYLVLDPQQRHGRGPFGPMIETDDCVYPTPLDQVDAAALPLWKRALAHSPRPLVAARFADLLWEARYGDTPHEWAQRATDAYLAAAFDSFGHVLEVTEGLQRAFEISTQAHDRPRKAAVIAALVGLARRSIDSEESSSGVSLSIIGLLVEQPTADRPAELDDLVERAIDRYRDDPWLLESVLDIKVRLVDPVERQLLEVAQIEAFTHRARNGEGQLRYAHLQHAIELAEQHGLDDMAVELRNEIDHPRPEPVAEPATTEPDVDEPRAAPDPLQEFTDRIVCDDDLSLALARFGACIPTANADSDLDVVPSADDPIDVGVREQELRQLAYFGQLAVGVLAGIRERYGPVSAAGDWFESVVIEATAARRVCRAIELYESGDFDAAALVLLPPLEDAVQKLACLAGVQPPGPVGGLLDALAGSLSERSRRYLRVLFAQRAEWGVATAPDAALLIHAACHLQLLQPSESSPLVARD